MTLGETPKPPLKADLIRRVALVAVVAAVSARLAGCVSGLDDAPSAVMPAPLSEVRSLAPAPGMVWVAGSWHWDDHAFVWIPGRWETAPPSPVLP